jgi:uncharacterized phage infection (PIP) family protein YhgE
MSKKMEERTEISAKWTGMKSKFPALSKGLFNPDLTPAVNNYDQALKAWSKVGDSEDKLLAVIDDLAKNMSKATSPMDALRDERDKVDKKVADSVKSLADKINSYKGQKDADMVDGEVLGALDGYATALDDGYTTHKSLTDQIAKHGAEMVAIAKKTRADYKSKSDAIIAGYKKTEADALKFAAQIRQIGANYQKVAIQMEKPDLVEAIRSLLDDL